MGKKSSNRSSKSSSTARSVAFKRAKSTSKSKKPRVKVPVAAAPVTSIGSGPVTATTSSGEAGREEVSRAEPLAYFDQHDDRQDPITLGVMTGGKQQHCFIFVKRLYVENSSPAPRTQSQSLSPFFCLL
jgi:hypothetical protein